MDQIFIKVENKGHWINKDLAAATYQERMTWYRKAKNYELAAIIEKLRSEK